jgi:hypothetical protein
VPQFIDPVFAKTHPKCSFSVNENDRFGLVFANTGSKNSGTDKGMVRHSRSLRVNNLRSYISNRLLDITSTPSYLVLPAPYGQRTPLKKYSGTIIGASGLRCFSCYQSHLLSHFHTEIESMSDSESTYESRGGALYKNLTR